MAGSKIRTASVTWPVINDLSVWVLKTHQWVPPKRGSVLYWLGFHMECPKKNGLWTTHEAQSELDFNRKALKAYSLKQHLAMSDRIPHRLTSSCQIVTAPLQTRLMHFHLFLFVLMSLIKGGSSFEVRWCHILLCSNEELATAESESDVWQMCLRIVWMLNLFRNSPDETPSELD